MEQQSPLASVWDKLKDTLPVRTVSSFLQAARMPEEQAQGQVRSVLGGVAQGLLHAAKLPGDVYQGNVSMLDEYGRTNPEVIGRSAELAGLVMGGGMPMAERGALGMAGGRIRALPSPETLQALPHPSVQNLKEFSRVESVDLSKARTLQDGGGGMNWEANARGEYAPPLFEGYATKPVAVRKETGEYVVLDGNHRTVNALNRGDKSLDMYVIDAKDYAPQYAGRKPQTDNIDTDELLRQLLGK
jgi:hypothetical protein